MVGDGQSQGYASPWGNKEDQVTALGGKEESIVDV